MITIKYMEDEERLEVSYNRNYIGYVNHDEHGWAGMEKVQNILLSLAKHMNIPIRILYT